MDTEDLKLGLYLIIPDRQRSDSNFNLRVTSFFMHILAAFQHGYASVS